MATIIKDATFIAANADGDLELQGEFIFGGSKDETKPTPPVDNAFWINKEDGKISCYDKATDTWGEEW